MCLIIAVISFALSIAFYTKGLDTQAIISLTVSLTLFSIFIYRLVKNRRCIFFKDCQKSDTI